MGLDENMSLNLKALDRWIQREDTPLELDCQEAKEYCGKCSRSSCLWLMEEAFKE